MRLEWLRRWTWNPMGTSRARSPARSLRSHFHIFRRSWEHEPTLVFASNWDWRTKDSQLLFLERTCRRQRLETTTTTILSKKSNNNASKKESTDGIKFHQNTNNVKRAVMAEWLRRWTWNPMGISRAGSNPARSVRSFFSDRYSGEVGREHEPILVLASNWDWRTKDSQLLFLERTCRRQPLETTTTTTLSKKIED